MSFMYKLKRVGAKIEPYGTDIDISCVDEFVFLYETNCFLCDKQLANHCKVIPHLMP